MSLRVRLALTYSVLVAVILGMFGIILYTTMQQSLEAEMDRRLQVRASQVQLTIWPGSGSLTPLDMLSSKIDLSPLADLHAPGLYVQVLDRAGKLIATSEKLRGIAMPTDSGDVAAALRGEQSFGTVAVAATPESQATTLRILTLPIVAEGNVVGVLQVGQSRQSLEDTMIGLRNLLLLLGTGAIVVSGLVGWLVAHRGLWTLSRMSEQASAIATERDFSRRLEATVGRDEVGRLGRTINQLLTTVDNMLTTHRQFVADTSHELRNPLLAIRTNLELIDRVADAEARAECIREARQQVERMSRLVADLLLLAQIDAGQIIERRPLALAPVLAEVTREASQRAGGRQIRLELPHPIEVLGDEVRLAQIVTNLVDNALKHSAPDGIVDVKAERQGGWAKITVSDTGEGIPAEHVAHVFDRFYRVEKARSNMNDGTGLGLAIVKHLTEAHGGRVSVESTPGEGSSFIVWLPLTPEPRSRLLLSVRLSDRSNVADSLPQEISPS